MRLGAEVTAYYVDFYGPMHDGVNDGDESDRCLVEWAVTDPLPGTAEAAISGATALTVGPDGRPVHGPAAPDAEQTVLHLPTDLVALRRSDAELARAWRHAVRDVLIPAYTAGRRITAVGRDGRYLISPAAGPATPPRPPTPR